MTRTTTHKDSPFDKPAYTRLKPDYCAFPLIGIPWLAFEGRSYKAARQTHSLLGTYIQLFEINGKAKSEIKFRITRPTGFLLFLLRGHICIHHQTVRPVSQLRFPIFYFSYNPAGMLTAQLDKGKHSFLVIGLEKSWFRPSTTTHLHQFTPLFNVWSIESPIPFALQQKRITAEVFKTVDRIRTTIVENMEDGLNVLQYVSKCLGLYHEQLVDPHGRPSQEEIIKGKVLKAYLADNFAFDDECKIVRILKNLDWSAWTLRKVANDSLGCSVGRYIAKLRMERAVKLLESTDMMIHEMAIKIGFSSAIAFIRAFKKSNGIPPNEYRKQKRSNKLNR